MDLSFTFVKHTHPHTPTLMTYQEKISFIDGAVERINNGLSWESFQAELNRNSSLYKKDVEDISRKVVKSVEDAHGSRIHDALMAQEENIDPAGLDPEIFEKIRARQEDTIRNTLKNRMARDLANGVPAAQALASHHHPLLSEEDIQKAVNKAKARIVAQTEEASNRSPLSLILGILFLVGGIGLTVASGGQAIFYGAIIVGLINIVKYAIG